MAADHFCLKWNNYQSNMVSELDSLRTNEDLVDVTLSCEGHHLRAHKVILSACSSYFRNVFKENPCKHPVVILKNVNYEDVEALLSFVYQGIVYISEKKLASFLQTAELLQIRGLTGAGINTKDDPDPTLAGKCISDGKTNATLPPPPPQLLTAINVGSAQKGQHSSIKTRSRSPPSPSTILPTSKRRKTHPNKISVKENCEESDTNSNQENSETENDALIVKSEISDIHDEQSYQLDNLKEETTKEDENVYYENPEEFDDTEEEEEDDVEIAKNLQTDAALEKPNILFSNAASNLSSSNVYSMLMGFSSTSVATEQATTGPERLGKRPCPLCNKIISNKSNLKKHMRIRHSDQYNPARCSLCAKVFKNKYSLRAHMNIYHKEFVYQANPAYAFSPYQSPFQNSSLSDFAQPHGNLPINSVPASCYKNPSANDMLYNAMMNESFIKDDFCRSNNSASVSPGT